MFVCIVQVGREDPRTLKVVYTAVFLDLIFLEVIT